MRLIDADAFGMYLADVQLANRGWKDDVCELLEDVLDALDERPTVDAVEVVRCKECIHRPVWRSCQGKREDDFCSYGERSEQ